MKSFAIDCTVLALGFAVVTCIGLATMSVAGRAQPPKPPASVPTQKVEPPAESTPTPKPFNLGRYSVENLV